MFGSDVVSELVKTPGGIRNTGMGQEAVHSGWRRMIPARGYHTISGKRYGRRHAYVSFRPITDKNRASCCTRSIEEDQDIGSEVLQWVHTASCSRSGHQDHRSRRRRVSSLYRAPSNHQKRLRREQKVPEDIKLCYGRESLKPGSFSIESRRTAAALSYISIDAYEPDSSGAEDENDLRPNSSYVVLREGGEESRLAPAAFASEEQGPLKTVQGWDSGLTSQGGKGNVAYTGPAEEGTPKPPMVVRPKIRRQTSDTMLERRKESEKTDVCLYSGRNKCVSAPPGFLMQPKLDEQVFSCSAASTLRERGHIESETVENDVWEDLERLGENHDLSNTPQESSDFSEGECSASWTSDSLLEKESSSILEEEPSLSLALEEQTPLEEGEVPWLMYQQQQSASSSDEEVEGMSQFVHPGLFVLDGNNNLEDDSSMSEDLDTEWRLLDEFGDGLGMAQAISYVDHSQLLTYMALEERLAQAMEVRSFSVDVEQAHPPATEQIIACLPQITIKQSNTEHDQDKEQCCAICCCEYTKDEIATLLPCRHMFHRLCVTLWLRKSGTCPVCRHVLTEQEAPAPNPSASEGAG
ncbi:hypothetical protein DNTS_012454 [Danionella cerebrum]|uniref:RING-type domain-containing protein n=1 Tax=Danionella cerebrum TaxID=2873325 RepID=A0A553QPB9_9TELE|nr:hypothetical protein DNTS_012454 [Danionella translucida]